MSPDEISVYRREPTPIEVAEASAQITRSVKEIDGLETQIHTLQAQIRSLQRQQTEYREAANRQKGVITLARRIPPELLAKIFEHCVDAGWTRGPVIISHVCSQWRRAAQDPRVWSRIYVNLDDANAVGRTKHWLRMAYPAPLHLTIVASHRIWPRQITEVMDVLSHHAQQWVTLDLHVDALQNIQAVATRCSHLDVMPNLRTISIATLGLDIQMDGESEATLALVDVFTPQRVPELYSLSIQLPFILSSFSLPIHLRSLELVFEEIYPAMPLPATSMMNMFRSLSQLEHLSLTLPLHHDQPFVLEAEDAVVLDHLTSLTVFGPTDLNGLLSIMQAPSLVELRIRSLEDLGYRQTPIGPVLHSFLQHSPLVEHLELYDIDISPEYFASCFVLLENLRDLRLHESSISAATLRLLYGQGEDTTSDLRMCQKLTRLDLRWCGQLSGKSLVELVRSRLPRDHSHEHADTVPSPITEITAINCCFVEEQDVMELARMTVCRVVIRDTDYCHARRCCYNLRYRQRLQFRHFTEISSEQRSNLQLIL